MSPSATPPRTRPSAISSEPPTAQGPRRRRPPGVRVHDQRGTILVSTLALAGILAILVMTGLALSDSATTGTNHESRRAVALQAADAGVAQYISRMVEDPLYYERFVDPAEDARVRADGVVVEPGQPWTGTPGESWTYQEPAVPSWRAVQDGRFGLAAYRLRIWPPQQSVGSTIVTVESVGRAGVGGREPVTRAVQAQIHPISLSDFQAVARGDINYGASATATGKLYSEGSINHRGVASADVYAERFVCTRSSGGCSSHGPGASNYTAGIFDSTTDPGFRDFFPNGIDFTGFGQSLDRIRGAALAGGIYRDDPSVDAWMLQFRGDGTVRIWAVDRTDNIYAQPGRLTCTPAVTMPGNGAMYFRQSVIVSDGSGVTDRCGQTSGRRDSVVNGRATVASAANVIVGGNIAYETSGDDVLGLIGNHVVIAEFAPTTLNWRAASLARSGDWRTWRSSPRSSNPHQSMRYEGSQAMSGGSFATQFQSREYVWDETLAFLRPPFYPTVEGSYTTRYWREVTSSIGA